MFKYETPPWGAKLICFCYLVVSCLMLFAFYTYGNWAVNSPVVFKYIFVMLGLIFMFSALKPREINKTPILNFASPIRI